MDRRRFAVWGVTLLGIIAAFMCLAGFATASTCVSFIKCPSDNSQITSRQPYSQINWTLFTIPSGAPLIKFTESEYERMTEDVMYNYSSLDLAMPHDTPVTDGYGADDFQWGWVSQSTLSSDPSAERFAPAAMGLNYTSCGITTCIGKFAYNPGNGVVRLAWVPDWCPPPCTMLYMPKDSVLDYLGLSMHEYGHAMGLDHSSNSSATMYGDGTPTGTYLDSLKRTLLPCEIEALLNVYHDNNPAAAVTGYSVNGSGGNVTATWNAEQESSTDHYVLEQATDWNGPFTLLATVPVSGTGTYSVPTVGSSSAFYRLSEVETDGDVLPLRTEQVMPPGPQPQFTQLPFNFDSTLTAMFANRARPTISTSGPTQYYIYCPDSLADIFQSLADAHTQWEGVPTEVVTYESIGGVVNEKAHTASHLPNGGWILKVGDAWDGKDVLGQQWDNNPAYYNNNLFTMNTWPRQPQLNISPMTYRRELAIQPMSMSYWVPFVAMPSDPVDFEGRGLPSPGYYLGYAPVSNRTEAQVFVAKSIQQMFTCPNPPANQMPPATMMTYALDYGSNSGARAKKMADSVAASMRNANNRLMLTSVTTWAGNQLSTPQRNAAMKAKFDAGMSMCAFISTVSQRYELGAYAHVDIPGYYFDVNALAANDILTFGIGLTCEMGFSRTEDPAYGTPVTERLEFVPRRGFWGYTGPFYGSFQGGNERYGKIFGRRQYSTPAGAIPPTVGELWNESVREMAAFKPDSLLAITYVLVGDPRGRIPSPGLSVVDVNRTSPIERPLNLMPNPAYGLTTFTFSLAAPSIVDLSIYDVAGRRVATVLKSFLSAGPQAVRWNFHEAAGRPKNAGIYFARLQVGNRMSQQRMVYLQ